MNYLVWQHLIRGMCDLGCAVNFLESQTALCAIWVVLRNPWIPGRSRCYLGCAVDSLSPRPLYVQNGKVVRVVTCLFVLLPMACLSLLLFVSQPMTCSSLLCWCSSHPLHLLTYFLSSYLSFFLPIMCICHHLHCRPFALLSLYLIFHTC